MDFPELRLKPEATPPGTTPGTVQDDVRSKPEDLAKVRTLAAQFESMLLSQMLKQMKDSMVPENDSAGFGGAIFADTVNTELGLALTKSGGVGLADSLMKALSRIDEQPGQSELEAAVGAMPFTSAAPMPMPMFTDLTGAGERAISSDFGWRPDPIHGQARFHAGLDLKLAYGQEVRAASDGVIKFAGEQAGYGTTVVVDHGNGLETRYAHLSSADVREGAVVTAGQPIARSGNSGRSTGAHLHFEVRQDGQPIDPDRVTGFFPVADLTAESRR
ncbi:MAG: peptidoglycan DD-metalloendopeptidase family protein [Vicinamibacterales bacterium]